MPVIRGNGTEQACFTLRQGDMEILKTAHRNVSAWVREIIAKECNRILRERKKRENARLASWEIMTHDPNL
jgi:hypothetical protein